MPVSRSTSFFCRRDQTGGTLSCQECVSAVDNAIDRVRPPVCASTNRGDKFACDENNY